MLAQPGRVDIFTQDDENSQAIMARIREENITDEATIRTIVDGYEFSSPEAKKHTTDRMIDLLNSGFFNSPQLKSINMNAIDTDAHN